MFLLMLLCCVIGFLLMLIEIDKTVILDLTVCFGSSYHRGLEINMWQSLLWKGSSSVLSYGWEPVCGKVFTDPQQKGKNRVGNTLSYIISIFGVIVFFLLQINYCRKWKSLSHVLLFVTPWTIQSWNSPGQNTGAGSLSLLQGIFPTQGSNPSLPHCRQMLYHLSHQGSHSIIYICVCCCCC